MILAKGFAQTLAVWGMVLLLFGGCRQKEAKVEKKQETPRQLVFPAWQLQFQSKSIEELLPKAKRLQEWEEIKRNTPPPESFFDFPMESPQSFAKLFSASDSVIANSQAPFTGYLDPKILSDEQKKELLRQFSELEKTGEFAPSKSEYSPHRQRIAPVYFFDFKKNGKTLSRVFYFSDPYFPRIQTPDRAIWELKFPESFNAFLLRLGFVDKFLGERANGGKREFQEVAEGVTKL